MAGGRPTDYRDDFPDRVRAMDKKRFTLDCIGDELGVAGGTISVWQNEYPEFRDAIKELRRKAVRGLESALFKGAVGYEYEETKVTKDLDKEGNVTKTHVEKTAKRRAPNAAMTIFALKNMDPEHYKNDPEPETDPDEDAEIIYAPLAGPQPKRKVKKNKPAKKKKGGKK